VEILPQVLSMMKKIPKLHRFAGDDMTDLIKKTIKMEA
jgi:hypothetical protein